jgi:hypothetical protein
MDDQTPELDGASEEATELELESTSTEETLGGDPLDEISDPVARAEAKKHRAIARRQLVKDEPKPAPKQEFLTKTDFFKSNERKAILQATADPEVKAIWSEVVPFFVSRRGKETPEDVLEDIKDAVTLYKARNPVVEKDTSADELVTSTVVKTGGGAVGKETPKTAALPNLRPKSQPKDWYAKKEG